MNSECKQNGWVKNQLQNIFGAWQQDNRLATKLFGSKKGFVKDRRQGRGHVVTKSSWIIHPMSSFRFYWDICMLLLLIANLIILPVAISFFNDDLSLTRIIFNVISDTIFLCDIVLNFRTGRHYCILQSGFPLLSENQI